MPFKTVWAGALRKFHCNLRMRAAKRWNPAPGIQLGTYFTALALAQLLSSSNSHEQKGKTSTRK
jgi:hypothetical protein